MADYLPLYKPGQAFTSQASATITGGQLLIVSGSGTVAPSSAAAATAVGVAAFDVASGAKVTVFAGGIQRVVASGAITAGANVEPATAGKVATHTNGTNDAYVVGVALTTAADGAAVEVLFNR